MAPDGLVYECWNDVTPPERAVLDLCGGEPGPAMRAELDRWLGWSPSGLPACRACPRLPQCKAGCPHVAMRAPRGPDRGDCSELLWNLPETVATHYLARRFEEAAEELRALTADE